MQLGVEKPDLKGLPIVIDNKKIWNLCSLLLQFSRKLQKKKTLLKSFTIQFVFFLFDFLMIEFETKVFWLIIQLWKKSITYIHHFRQKNLFLMRVPKRLSLVSFDWRPPNTRLFNLMIATESLAFFITSIIESSTSPFSEQLNLPNCWFSAKLSSIPIYSFQFASILLI